MVEFEPQKWRLAAETEYKELSLKNQALSAEFVELELEYVQKRTEILDCEAVFSGTQKATDKMKGIPFVEKEYNEALRELEKDKKDNQKKLQKLDKDWQVEKTKRFKELDELRAKIRELAGEIAVYNRILEKK